MGHIFISYSRKDGNDYADEIETFLKANGLPFWRDVRNLKPEEDFTAAIEAAIETASYVLVCISPESKGGDSFVRREIQYALAEHSSRLKKNESLPVIPLRFVDIKPHVSIINNEWINLFLNRQTAEKRLLEIVSGGSYTNRPSDAPEYTDPLRPYVQYLYQRVVQYLKQAIITQEIPLTSETTPDAVPNRQPDMMDQFFMAKGIQSSSDDQHTFTTFTEAFNHPAFEHRVLLLGQPGAGKTITLMAYTRDAAAAWLDKPAENPLPLLGTIATWDAYQQPSFADWLGRAYSQLTPADVQRALDSGKALLLLDGLDELGSERPVDPAKPDGDKFDPRQRFLALIDAFVGTRRAVSLPTAHILVTCRPKDYDQIGAKIALNGAITLQPLDDAQIAAYLHDQPELLTAIMNDAPLREVAQTPLLLSIFGFVYQGMSETERAELANLKQAGDIRDKIFNAYIDERYKHEARKRNADLSFSLEEVRDILARLVWNNVVDYYASPNVFREFDIFEASGLEYTKTLRLIEFVIQLNLLAYGAEDNSSNPTYRLIHLLLCDTLGFSFALERIHDDRVGVRESAIYTFIITPDSRVFHDLLIALKDTYPAVRKSAADALGRLSDPRALDALLVALQDVSPSVRSSAAAALGRLTDPRTLDALLIALQDTYDDVRSSATRALGKLRDARAVDGLLIAIYDKNQNIRLYAADALGLIADPRALNGVLDALHNGDDFRRIRAAEALGIIGNSRAVDGLLDTLYDKNQYVSSSAARSLKEIGTPEALAGLERWRREQGKT